MKLSIIIVSYNTSSLLKNCLSSIQNSFKDTSIEVFVVDNNSSDDSVAMVKKEFPKVTLIENNENFGFAKANNQAIEKTKGEYVFLLNSDTEVEGDALEILTSFLDKESNVAVVGPKLLNTDNTLQASCGTFFTVITTFFWLLGFERFGLLKFTPNNIQKVDWVSGAAFMIRKSTIDTIGLLDEHFFMYLEEMEWCYRANKKGLQTYFNPHATILHKGLGSSNKSFAIIQIYKGLVYFFKKHKSMLELKSVYFLLVFKAYTLIIIGEVLGKKDLSTTYKKALANL